MRDRPNIVEGMKAFGVALLATAVVGCGLGSDPNDYLKVEDVRTKLALNLPSYSSIAEVKQLLKLREDQITVWEDGKTPQSAYRPQFNIYSIFVEHLEIQGYPGRLKLTFFNDRLEATWFYPEDFNGFVNSLDLDRTVLEKNREGITNEPFTRMWINTDFQNKPYIGWEDVRLSQQSMDWIDHYA